MSKELKRINSNLGGEGAAALLACFIANNGNVQITKEQYEKLPKFYRIEMWADGDTAADTTTYEARLVGKDKLDPGETSDSHEDEIPAELKQLLDSLGAGR